MPLGGLVLSILPVSAFLVLLVLMDSFKLVTLRGVLRSLGLGACGLAALYATLAPDHAGVDLPLRELAGPVVKRSPRRCGSSGSPDASHRLHGGRAAITARCRRWLRAGQRRTCACCTIRASSCGSCAASTAILHGSTTAIFATLAKSLSDRHATTALGDLLLPLALAAVIHSLFNHFVLPPLATTALLLVVMPLLFVVVFEHSEKSTRTWIGTSFDSRMELLELILSGDLHATPVGTYLQSLRDRFPPVVVADMLCYLRIYSELSMRAKAMHIARQAGLKLEAGEDVRANIQELKYLGKSIGRTGRLALAPFLESSAHGFWEMHALQK
jgi:hypothetical protein